MKKLWCPKLFGKEEQKPKESHDRKARKATHL